MSPHFTVTEILHRIQLPLHFGIIFNVSRREINTYISPLVEEFSCIPLQLLVPFVAHDRRTPTGQPFLGNVHMVALHPLGPVATITAVNEARTLEEQGCSRHDGSFLKGLQKITLNTNTLEKLSKHQRVFCFSQLFHKFDMEPHRLRNLSTRAWNQDLCLESHLFS